MNDPVYNQLLETALKRPLTAEESARLQAYFEAHPEARVVWEEEMGLNRLLKQLPEHPVSNRFTAEVMAAVERDAESAPERAQRPAFVGESYLALGLRWVRSLGWAPRIGAVALAAVLAVAGYHQYQGHLRSERARSVALVADVASLAELGLTMTNTSPLPAPGRLEQAEVPDVQVFQDFEPIYRLSQVPPPMVDDELLAALE